MFKISLFNIHQQVSSLLPSINHLLVTNFFKTNKVSFKSTNQLSISVVTKLDSQIETSLKSSLTQILPGSGFIGEETDLDLKPEYNWIVDPIDGTLNFASHISSFAVSIALWHKNEPVYSLVSFPMFNETIYAIKGKGIYLNNRPIKPRAQISPKPFIVYGFVGNSELVKKIYSQIVDIANNPRSYGSCVYHGSYIALGRINAGVFINEALWDIAAIILLVKEAGLNIKYLNSAPQLDKDNLKAYQYSLVMGSKDLVEKLTLKI